MNHNRDRLRIVCEGAITIALAWALSYLEIDLWFQGGSIGVTMLPLFLFAMRRGAGWGCVTGFVFGTLKFYMAGGWALSWQSMLLDYTVAYALVGLAGLYRAKGRSIVSPVIGGMARFCVHYISGVTIYAQYMPDEFWGMSMASPFIYSALYNGGYVVPSLALCCILIWTMSRSKPIQNFING